MIRQFLYVVLLGALVSLAGCSSIAKGITEGVLAHQEQTEDQDFGLCEIRGPAQEGLTELMMRQRTAGADYSVKILKVHGIGKHLPGYSASLQQKLSAALMLNVVAEKSKEIQLLPVPRLQDELGKAPIGTLRVSRHTDKEETRELLFYELTWSSITEAEKAVLAFDDSYEYTHRRATLNNTLKRFFNGSIPDPIIYTGSSKGKILSAVTQSICWAYHGDWKDLPDGVTRACNPLDANIAEQIREDELVIITHSLGSRIVMDALQAVAELHREGDKAYRSLFSAFKSKTIPVYMFANQLPLLQLGFADPVVSNQLDRYCSPTGDRYEARLFDQVRITAFSDPNDILSYAIPTQFAEDHIDSQLCPKVTNVIINVAPLTDLPVIGEFANPLSAHREYEDDPRIIGLIVEGIGEGRAAPVVSEQCEWIETR